MLLLYVVGSDSRFIYVERPQLTAGVRSEDYVFHGCEDYPTALKKKVILLKHFRDFLLDSSQRSTTASAATSVSSSAGDSTPPPSPLPHNFMRKWISLANGSGKLFRLSNTTVQVFCY